MEQFRISLGCVDWNPICNLENVNSAFSSFVNILVINYNIYCPLATTKRSRGKLGKNQKSWFTPELKSYVHMY